jgi:hypothetical protein
VPTSPAEFSNETSVLKARLDPATSTTVPLTRTGFAMSGIRALLEVPLAMAGPPTSTKAATTVANACRAHRTVVVMRKEIMFETPDVPKAWSDRPARALLGNETEIRLHCTCCLCNGPEA